MPVLWSLLEITCFLLHHQFFALCLYLSSLRKAMALQYIALNYKGSVPVGLLGRAWAAGSRGSSCRQQLRALAGWLELPWTGRRNPWQRWREGRDMKKEAPLGMQMWGGVGLQSRVSTFSIATSLHNWKCSLFFSLGSARSQNTDTASRKIIKADSYIQVWLIGCFCRGRWCHWIYRADWCGFCGILNLKGIK